MQEKKKNHPGGHFLLQHIVSSFVSGDDHTLLGYFFPNTNSCGEEKYYVLLANLEKLSSFILIEDAPCISDVSALYFWLSFHHQHLYFLDKKEKKREKTGSNSSNAIFFLMAMHTNSLVYYYTYIHILLLVAFTPSLISLLANKIPPFLNVRVGFKKWWQVLKSSTYKVQQCALCNLLGLWSLQQLQPNAYKI